MEFAVFAVKLGWSLDEYQAITPRQRQFILKEIENETVRQSELLQDIVELAIANTHRKKGKRRMRLWNKVRNTEPKKPVSNKEMSRIKKAFANKFKRKNKDE